MRRKIIAHTLLPLIIALVAAAASAQAAKDEGSARLEQGLQKFERSDFPSALSLFQGILLDPSAKARHPEAAYWSALAYVGLKDYENADRTMALFLTSYPSSPLFPDALYQQGRVAFLRQEHGRALSVFQNFLETYPNSDLYPSALFWAGECMYQLGKLKQAESVFLAIVKEFPEGVKTEAANYRLGLIDLKYREDELLKLLKWSHEESLRIIEEYKGREKTYEQALNAYQKQIALFKAGGASIEDLDRLAELEEALAALNLQSTASAQESAALKLALAKAEADREKALADLAAAKAQAPVVAGSPGSDSREALLDIKEDALDLKERYLELLSATEASGGASR